MGINNTFHYATANIGKRYRAVISWIGSSFLFENKGDTSLEPLRWEAVQLN